MARKPEAKSIPFGELTNHLRTVGAAALMFTSNVQSLGSKLESGRIPADKVRLVGEMLLEEAQKFSAVMWPGEGN